MKVFNTACPRNCYSTCSLKVFVEKNKITKIENQPLNLSTPNGTCLKGLSYVERSNSKKRIIKPLKKVNGEFVEIDYDNALNEISEKLKFYKKQFGAESIFFYSASGSAGLLNSISHNFWKNFGKVTTTYGNLCWPAGLEAVRLTLGEVKHNVTWDIENSKLIILWGKNPAETNIHQMVHIEKAVSNGAKLIVIDPRRTPSSEIANMLIQPKQGTDGLLALTLAKLIVEKNLDDLEFIENNVYGFSKFKESLNIISIENTSKLCGVPIDFIEELANLIGNIKPMTIVPGYGMQRFTNGGQTTRCLLALSVITGNIGKKGACFHYADLQSDVFSKLKEPLSYFPENDSVQHFRRTISTAKLGKQMLETKNPQLKLGWVERGNPITQNPESRKVYEAFRKLEYLVVVDQFFTDTAMEADLILPSKTMFEQSDIITSYWNPYIQLKQKVVEPPENVKPETEIYYNLAVKLGFSKKILEKDFVKPTEEGVEAFLENKLKSIGYSLEQLKKGPVLPKNFQKIAFEDLKFNTQSGKIELYSDYAKNKWNVNPLPTYELLKENENDGFSYFLMSPNTKNRIHSQFGNLEIIKELSPFPYCTISGVDAKKLNISNGDIIRVYNNRGELKLKAKIDFSLRPKSVVIYNGYWHQEGACPNSLSIGRETDMGYGSAFHDNMVNIEKMEMKNE